jgi:hypothetical protein
MLKFLKKLPLKYFDIIEPTIFQAIKYHDEDKALSLLKKYNLLDKTSIENLNNTKVNQFGDNLLMDCVIKQKPSLVEYLLESQKFDLSFENNKEENCLYYVAKYQLRSNKVVQLMVEQQAPAGTKRIEEIAEKILTNSFFSLLKESTITQFLLGYNIKPTETFYIDFDGTPYDLIDWVKVKGNDIAVKAVMNMNAIPYERLKEELEALNSVNINNQFKNYVDKKIIEIEKEQLEAQLTTTQTKTSKSCKI